MQDKASDGEMDSLLARNKFLQDSLQSHETKIDLLKQEVTALKGENTKLSESHASSRKRSEATISELNDQLESMRYFVLIVRLNLFACAIQDYSLYSKSTWQRTIDCSSVSTSSRMEWLRTSNKWMPYPEKTSL